jgi:hypothetical protein
MRQAAVAAAYRLPSSQIVTAQVASGRLSIKYSNRSRQPRVVPRQALILDRISSYVVQ